MKYQAIIFDCDGVLVDSEPYSCYAWNVLFQREYQIDIGTNYSDVLGKSGTAAAHYYCSQHNLKFSEDLLKSLSLKKEKIYYDLAQNNLQPKPGIHQLIKECHQNQIKMAVASSGSLKKIQFSLSQPLVDLHFDHIIDASQVSKGKPHPDIFLKAANILQIPIDECIVIEDSIAGIMAAQASGAFTIGLVGTFSKESLSKANLILDSITDLRLNEYF